MPYDEPKEYTRAFEDAVMLTSISGEYRTLVESKNFVPAMAEFLGKSASEVKYLKERNSYEVVINLLQLFQAWENEKVRSLLHSDEFIAWSCSKAVKTLKNDFDYKLYKILAEDKARKAAVSRISAGFREFHFTFFVFPVVIVLFLPQKK